MLHKLTKVFEVVSHIVLKHYTGFKYLDQQCLSKQCRLRLVAASDQGLHCLPFIQQVLSISTGSKQILDSCHYRVYKVFQFSTLLSIKEVNANI